MITRERLVERLDYNSETGVFTWRGVQGSSRCDKIWNTRYAGQRAGCVNPAGYRRIRIDDVYYRAHRLAWLYVHGVWPKEEVDHINRVRDDDSIRNLRLASRRQNCANTKAQSRSKSGIKGVIWNPHRGKWQANICWGGKGIYLGAFSDISDAANAYAKAASELHGEFANFGRAG